MSEQESDIISNEIVCTTVEVAAVVTTGPSIVPLFSAYKGVIIDSSGPSIVHTVPKYLDGSSVSDSNEEDDSPHSLYRTILNEAPLESLASSEAQEFQVTQFENGTRGVNLTGDGSLLLELSRVAAALARNRILQIEFVSPDGQESIFTVNRALPTVEWHEIENHAQHLFPELYDYGMDLGATFIMESGLVNEAAVTSDCSGGERLDDEDEESTCMSDFSPDGVAVCPHCKFFSPDPNICQRCRRRLPPEALVATQENQLPANVIPITNDYSSSKDSSGSDTSPTKNERPRRTPVYKRKRCTKKARKQEEDVLVVLSSDDEDDPRKKHQNRNSKYPEPLTDVFSKEPTITPDTESSLSTDTDNMTLSGGGMENLLDSSDVERIKLDCRTVRFGSYKVVPTDKIVLTDHGLKMKVPCLSKNNTSVIKIFMKDIVKVLVHFGQSAQVSSGSAPAMFYYITHDASKRIRDSLHMTNMSQDVYFDSTSKEELHKRITLLPETISQVDRLFIKSIYESRSLMEELSWDEANDILVRAAPKEVQHTLKKDAPKHMPSTSNTNSNIKIIMVYPPPPSKGGISINTEDYACLKEDQFLNDVIIDFYLKYLWLNVLSDEDRNRTHIFSSFFYKRLTMISPRQANEKLTPAEKRHARVKGWTKSVDIFEKDFIIIPINERSHWFLGIICFPGLTGPVRMSDDTPVPSDSRKRDTSVLAGGQAPAKIWGTTISIVKTGKEKDGSASRSTTISLVEPDERGDDSDRDEAEADDDDMEPNTSDEESTKEEELMDEATPRMSKTKPCLEPIKQPCILIFDSLACASRSRVCATLREYLQVEWKVRNKGKSRDFSKDVIKGAVPKVPQQTNFIDCGVYVLQYVEAFFKHPITDYRMPIRSIKEWFTTDEVNRKRYDIMQLLLSLMREQNVDIGRLNLPHLDLNPFPEYEGDDEEVMDDEGEYDEGLEEGEEEPLGEEEEDEMDEDDEPFQPLDERIKNKRFERISSQRIEQLQSRIEISSSGRLDPSPRLDRLEPSPRQSPRRFDSPSPRIDARIDIKQQEPVRTEPARSEPTPSRPRLPDAVTICEANSKRKLPLSLKDIRSPRVSTPQTSIEKVKKMRVD